MQLLACHCREDRGPLDYGQYYAARTGSGAVQSGTNRRVLFSATGWHNPPGWPNPPQCKTQMHLIPRDLLLDAQGRLTFNPIPELATLRESGPGVGGTAPQWMQLLPTSHLPPRSAQPTPAAAAAATAPLALQGGSSVELRMNCSGRASTGQVGFDLLSEADHTKFVKVVYDYAAVELQVDHTNGGGADKAITQTAPLRGGLDSKGGEGVELVVLLDGALIEVFLNRRAVISSFSTHVFAAGSSTAPASRSNFALSPPAGVTCSVAAWSMKKLPPAGN